MKDLNDLPPKRGRQIPEKSLTLHTLSVKLTTLNKQAKLCRKYETNSRRMGLIGTANEWKLKLDKLRATRSNLLIGWINKEGGRHE